MPFDGEVARLLVVVGCGNGRCSLCELLAAGLPFDVLLSASSLPGPSPYPLRVGDIGASRGATVRRFCAEGDHVPSSLGVDALCNLEGVVGRVDWYVGVKGLTVAWGDADGDSCRRNGDARGELNERGEGL